MKDPRAFDFDGDYGEDYDGLVKTVIPGYDHLFQATLALFQTRLDRQAHILIVGCGTGRELITFASAQPQWRFTAVDPSIQMIETTAAAVERLGLSDRVTLHHGYVDDLPAQPSFDAATVINVMHFLPDDGTKEHLIGSVARRVRTGAGVALFDLHGTPSSASFNQLMDAWSAFMALRGLTGDAHSQFLKRLADGIVYVSEARILEMCRQAGLALSGRYFGGFLYGGWFFLREPRQDDTGSSLSL